MTIWVAVIVVVCILAIIFFSGSSQHKTKTREEYLEELGKYLEGKVAPLTGETPGYQLTFNFEGRDFTFEDIEQEGFQEKVHKAYLKTKTNSSLTMSFTEAARMTIRSQVVQASDINDEYVEKVRVPKALDKFQIFTNHVEKVNALFDDPKALKLFIHYFNIGSRGEPAMAVRLQDGILILEFFESAHMRPNLFDLMQTPAKIEEHLFNLLALAKTVEVIDKAAG